MYGRYWHISLSMSNFAATMHQLLQLAIFQICPNSCVRILDDINFLGNMYAMIYSSKMYTRIVSYGSTFSRLIPCVYKVYKINYNRYATMVVYFRRRRSLFCSASVFCLMLRQSEVREKSHASLAVRSCAEGNLIPTE